MDTNLIRGALYYAHPSSGASDEKAQGVIVGVVTALMANGKDFGQCLEFLANNLPIDFRTEAIPQAWWTKQFTDMLVHNRTESKE